MEKRTRIFYRDNPREVVVELEGKTIAVYKSVDELVEHHAKGLLAVEERRKRLPDTTDQGESRT